MPFFMDHHKGVEGLTVEAVADAHSKDLEIQGEHGVKYHRYWFNEESGEVFCLAEAPNKEAAEAVHREAHGLVAGWSLAAAPALLLALSRRSVQKACSRKLSGQ